jgi:DNA-binding FrmR family transcriptional regulator
MPARPSESLQSDLIRRLRSAEGHLRGIIGMLEADADCQDIVRQVLAVQGALREVNRLVVRHSLYDCLRTALSSPDAEARERAVAGVLALYELRGALALPSDRKDIYDDRYQIDQFAHPGHELRLMRGPRRARAQ